MHVITSSSHVAYWPNILRFTFHLYALPFSLTGTTSSLRLFPCSLCQRPVASCAEFPWDCCVGDRGVRDLKDILPIYSGILGICIKAMCFLTTATVDQSLTFNFKMLSSSTTPWHCFGSHQ